MTAPPARSVLAGSPDHATAKAWYLQLVDFLYDRLGGGAGAANSSEQDVSCGYLGAVRTTQLYGTRNRLHNGGFSINQRGFTSVGDDAYCLDRWYVLTESGNVTVAQQTDQENGTPYNIRLTQPDASAKRIGLAQIIEAANCKDLRSKITTLAGRLRCSAATQINYAVLEWTGTADSVTSDFVSVWGASPTYVANITERAKGTITPGVSTWTDMPALNATINAGINNLIIFVWSNSALAQNTTLDLSRMQFEPGAYATPFEFRDIALERALCQRRCVGVVAHALGLTLNTTTLYHGVMRLPVTMAATPTLLGGSSFTVNSGSAGTPALQALPGGTSSVDAVVFNNSAANWSTNALVAFTGLLSADL